jgi:hypothetical protein
MKAIHCKFNSRIALTGVQVTEQLITRSKIRIFIQYELCE